LPADSLRKGLAEHTLQSVTLNSGLAKIVLSADVLESAVKDDVKQVELSIATVTLSQLAESVKTRIGNNPVYDLSLSADGTPVSFTGKQAVTITMDYTLQPGEQADRIVVYFIDDNKGMQVVKNARYDAAAGKVTFSPNQFGKYTILHANVSFADLGAASWAQEPVLFLAAREIVDGVAEGSFQPNGQVTRAQFVKLLVEALDLKAEQADSGFTDTVEGAWYDSYVKTAKKLGIVNGREDGSFGANDPIKREDLAVMINRALQYLKADLRGSSDYAVAFIDQDSISDYAREPIAELTRSGIVNGLDGGVFGPAKQATRAEAAVMIYRLLQFI
jgi:endo-1,4-beta-xylanase